MQRTGLGRCSYVKTRLGLFDALARRYSIHQGWVWHIEYALKDSRHQDRAYGTLRSVAIPQSMYGLHSTSTVTEHVEIVAMAFEREFR